MTLARRSREAATLLTGMLAGAMLLIRFVLVRFWQRLPPEAFREWFRDNSGRIGAVMFPLGGAATASTVAAATLSRGLPRTNRRSLWLAAACSVGVAAVTVLVNEPTNEQFNGHELSLADTPAALARWRRWHNVRVLLGTAAAIAAVRSLPD